VSRVFVTGGSGLIGGALVERLVARGDDVVGLARSDAAAAALQGRGAEVVRGDAFDEAALVRGMDGAALAFHVAGMNKFCVEDPEPMRRVNVDGAVAAVHAAARAGVPRLVHTSSAATLGEAPGTIGREDTPHRGWYLSVYERTKTEGERAVLAAARETGQDVVLVNPSSAQGPGRAGGTGRFLLAFLDGRMKVFVQTNVSLVDIADCVQGHLLAAERGRAGERYLLNGMTLTLTESLALAAEVAGVQRTPRLLPRPVATIAAGAVEGGFRLARRHPPVCREMVRTLLHGHRYDGSRAERELGLRYTDPAETVRRTVDWARSAGLLKNV
jgi:dihydroflavonol-4-reductase